MSGAEPLLAGWGKPGISRKWHYFGEGEIFSLCNRIGFWGSRDREDTDDDHKDNCAECRRRVAKLRKESTKE